MVAVEALRAYDALEIELMAPTLRTLQEIAEHDSARCRARGRPRPLDHPGDPARAPRGATR